MVWNLVARLNLYQLLFITALVILAAHPILWLVSTWFDPSYGSYGLAVFLLVVGLAVWSASSPKQGFNRQGQRQAIILLCLAALIRLLGQILGINVIGALALVIDVYAIGVLLALPLRRRPISPGWLAVLFALSLPLERIIQRSIGFVLQQVSATGACEVLSLGSYSLQCEGVRIMMAGQDVLVDLPCSGARGLLQLLLLFFTLAAVKRPGFKQALIGMVITLASALAGNILRICLLALGLVFGEEFLAIDVMAKPWHEIIGLGSLVLSALPVLFWAHWQKPRQTQHAISQLPVTPIVPTAFKARRAWMGIFPMIIAVVIVSLPARPVDVARVITAPKLPDRIADMRADKQVLTAQEQSYFSRYGGGASRALYGPFGLLVVRTSAPLRHLHAPDECLTGAGHTVRYLGRQFSPLATAVYRSEAADGQVYRIMVSFISDEGQVVASVAEAVWYWLQSPKSTWTMVQRIAPWQLSHAQIKHWENAVALAMDLPKHPAFNQVLTTVVLNP